MGGGVDGIRRQMEQEKALSGMEVAGPRQRIYFDPTTLRCGIVTCRGLCPGLNDVLRAIVVRLHHHYGVQGMCEFR